MIIREILAINPDSLLGGKRTNEFAHFFFVLFVDELYLSNEINILQRSTSARFQSYGVVRQCTLNIIAEALLVKQNFVKRFSMMHSCSDVRAIH